MPSLGGHMALRKHLALFLAGGALLIGAVPLAGASAASAASRPLG